MINSIPEGKMREAALKRIEILDCANPDKTLASCDPAVNPPPEVLDWQNKLQAAHVDDEAYARALAKEVRSLLCASDANAIYILRGVVIGATWHGGFAKTGRETPALVDFILSGFRLAD